MSLSATKQNNNRFRGIIIQLVPIDIGRNEILIRFTEIYNQADYL